MAVGLLETILVYSRYWINHKVIRLWEILNRLCSPHVSMVGCASGAGLESFFLPLLVLTDPP
jgi:hypothetical protein